MKTITFVTGSQEKLNEFMRIAPAGFPITHASLDLDEIQSVDADVLIADKAKRAYEQIGGPVIVEDVAAGLDELEGLPGPFIKFFNQKLGNDALYKLAGKEAPATATCTIGYYDGKDLLIARGEVKGKVIKMREGQGFGFDYVFMPEGYDKTFAEMGPEEKDKVSHRGRAIRDLVDKLNKL